MPTGVYKHKPHTKESIEKMRLAQKGKKISEEQKIKMRKRLKGKIGENAINWKGGRRKASDGYIMIHNWNHPLCNGKGYVREHRIIAEKHLKKYLTKEEQIHHINEIKDDNRLENLYLFPTSGKHTSFHHLKNKPILESNLI